MATECSELLGCTRRHWAKGLCQPHYIQRYRGQELRPLGTGRPRSICSAALGCERPVAAQGLCNTHYRQMVAGRKPSRIRVARDICVRDELGRKECCTCREWKPVEEFYPNKRSRDGLMSLCRQCSRAYTLYRKYRITPERYAAMLAEQGGRCAICRCVPVPNKRGTEFTVDHDHSCCPDDRSCGLCIRGLLCVNCNIALGAANDDVDRLRAMIVYLGDHHE